jgi:hypothetical protein
MLRGVKLAQYLARRARGAQKSLYFRLRDSRRGRAMLKVADFARAPREITHRRGVAAPYIASLPAPIIDQVTGYGLLPPLADERVMAASRRLFERKQAKIEEQLAGLQSWSPERQAKYLSRKQSFLRYLLNDEDLRRNPELVDFALSEQMLGPATQYLGMVPFLTRVDLMYSLPRDTSGRIASQLFHLDHEGLTQIKCFVHVFDVGDAEGPFTFIPADATARIVKDIRRLRRQRGQGRDVESRRYLDDEIAAVGGTGSIVTVKGPAGAGVAVDTSRCLHLGSRVDPGTFRLCLYLQYCTTREVTNVFDVERFRGDPVRHLAVTHSLEPGRARATDYTHRMIAG